MWQISKIIQHSYSTVANLQQYGQMWQNFLFFYIIFLSPLPSFFLFSSLSLSDSLSSPSNPNPLLSNLSLSLSLPLPVFLGAVALLDLDASMLTKTLTFAAAFSAFGDSIPWLIALAFFFTLAFNTIRWIDWAKAAIVPGLVSLIVGVICNGVRRGAVVVWGDFVMGLCRWLFGSWWCSGGVGPWLWLGVDQSKISLCLQTKTEQEKHPKP